MDQLERARETAVLADRVQGRNDGNAPVGHNQRSRDTGNQPSAHWLRMHLGSSPVLGAELARGSVDLAGTVGVPRGIHGLDISSECACLVAALIKADGPDRQQVARTLRDATYEVEGNGNDPVGLATLIPYPSFGKEYDDLLAFDVPGHVIELLDATWIVSTMVNDPGALEERNWKWTSSLNTFFQLNAYRGIRRRAARSWGRGLQGDFNTIFTQFPFAAFKNRGLASFTAEWIIARMRNLIAKPLARKAQHAKAVKVADVLTAYQMGDIGQWIQQEAGKCLEIHSADRGGQWD